MVVNVFFLNKKIKIYRNKIKPNDNLNVMNDMAWS